MRDTSESSKFGQRKTPSQLIAMKNTSETCKNAPETIIKKSALSFRNKIMI